MASSTKSSTTPATSHNNIYTGCGNTFVLIDNRDQHFSPDQNAIVSLCKDRTDGLILLENSQIADYRMRIFNNDGKETEMCGNGLRCLIRFIEHLGDPRTSFTIQTFERLLKAENRGEMIAIEMGGATDVRLNETVEVEGRKLRLHYLNTGVPHAVLFTNLSEDFDVDGLGRKIRFHPHYAPKGANADFAEVQDNEVINLRTYERGVEGETLACGTGATAVALAAAEVYGLKSPIAVRTRSGEILHVAFGDGVWLIGPAKKI